LKVYLRSKELKKKNKEKLGISSPFQAEYLLNRKVAQLKLSSFKHHMLLLQSISQQSVMIQQANENINHNERRKTTCILQ
jgi:hypothetical protein